MQRYNIGSAGEFFNASGPGKQGVLALLQVLVVIVVSKHAGENVVGDLVCDERLEPQVWQASNQRSAEVMHVTGRHALQRSALEQGKV